MFQPAQVKVAGAGEKLQGDNSDSFFSLAQNIPINPHHPHHWGNFRYFARCCGWGRLGSSTAGGSALPHRGRQDLFGCICFAGVLPRVAAYALGARRLAGSRHGFFPNGYNFPQLQGSIS
jgi:hypothetical protein